MLKWIAIFTIAFIMGCSFDGQYWDYEWEFPYRNSCKTIEDTLFYALRLDFHKLNQNEWKLPHETYEQGGDCEDFAIFVMYLLYAYVGKTPTMLRVKIDSITHHMVVEIDKQIYDPSGSRHGHIDNYPYKIIDSYTYGEAMYLATVR